MKLFWEKTLLLLAGIVFLMGLPIVHAAPSMSGSTGMIQRASISRSIGVGREVFMKPQTVHITWFTPAANWYLARRLRE